MNTVVGVELCADVVRAVALNRWGKARQTASVAWDPARPDDAVAALRNQLGPARRVALSVGLGFLHVKQVKLPPVAAAERRRILSLEPDRFFPVQDQLLVVSLVQEENLAFAVDALQLESWISAFAQWAPVDSVDAAPVSLARALGRAAHGTFGMPAGRDEHGLVEVQHGRVRSARRVPSALGPVAVQPLPENGSLPSAFLTALGCARGVDAALDDMLLPAAQAGLIRGRRRQRIALATGVCALSFGLALWSLDSARERMLSRINAELARVTPQAGQAIELHDQLSALDRESAAIEQIGQRRVDPLRVLAALSERLPEGATVLNLRANGEDWQIDGTARDAAALLPLLDRDERFDGVRFLSASSRFREAARTYETFSIAFRVRAGS